MKVFERAVRRANIPIVMSEGFNPHPKLSILLALGLGIAGLDEILELELVESIPSEILIERLTQQLPKEICVLSIETIPHSPKSSVNDITYDVIFKDTSILETLKIGEFLQQSSIIVNRTKDGRQKSFNIRPSIKDIVVKHNGLSLNLKMTSKGMARPEEILHALCMNKEKMFFEIIRTKINLSSDRPGENHG
ncbi:MAG: hypothetical protein A2099_02195 [Planctomycetes bacterium GWF2_39_10]|nr:MAG: hypothetical protein A2Y09_11080 [Planctomycetes bacterium GWA2_39_15]OHB42552.1 MAG: hypothetical protein A2Y11_05710 [Planctomycetes bacterium GWC2_39_26]OHB50836.1 MAG: hypothetical protein A2099_02195 [Planctomycetes bacterium GWF2_39_10]